MMIFRKSKTDPKDQSVVAACDRCKAECEASRLPRGGPKAINESEAIAKSEGWKEETVRDRNPRRRKFRWTVELVCPKCSEEGEGQ